jgi:hypothetical protein
MRIKLADLKLAIEQIPAGTEVIDVQGDGHLMELEFSEGNAIADTTIVIYPASQNTTPDIRRTAKLYKKV